MTTWPLPCPPSHACTCFSDGYFAPYSLFVCLFARDYETEDGLAADERTWALLDGMADIALRSGRSVAQVALRWLLQRHAVTSVVIGVKTLEQLDENLGATSYALSAEDMAKLDALSAIPVPCEYKQSANHSKRHTPSRY